MDEYWRPRFLTPAVSEIASGQVGPFWNVLFQSQSFSDEIVPIRNFIQPAGLIAWLKVGTTQVQPAMLTAVSSGNSKIALLTETDRITGYSAPTQYSVGVASGEAVAAKSGRRYLCLVNTSINWIYLAFDQAAEVGKGIALAPNGGCYEMTAAAGNLSDSQVRAIASGAASNLAIQEV